MHQKTEEGVLQNFQKDQESLEENYCREHGTGFGPRPGGYDRSLC